MSIGEVAWSRSCNWASFCLVDCSW
jgi:hypothetical protein